GRALGAPQPLAGAAVVVESARMEAGGQTPGRHGHRRDPRRLRRAARRGGPAMTGFSDLLARSVFALRLELTDAAVDRGDGGEGSSERGSAAPSDATTAGPATVVPPPSA